MTDTRPRFHCANCDISLLVPQWDGKQYWSCPKCRTDMTEIKPSHEPRPAAEAAVRAGHDDGTTEG